ncbi:MAG: HlyD family efflux transporter periplasmic adaptor subunit [Planctomycetota bacterium]
MRTLAFILILLLVAFACAFPWLAGNGKLNGIVPQSWLPASAQDQPDSSDGNDEPVIRRIHALGRIEPAGGIVGVFAKPGDRVERLSEQVKEGGEVEAKSSLGVLATRKAQELQLAVLDARIGEANSVRQAADEARKADMTTAVSSVEQVRAATKELEAKKRQIEILSDVADQAKKEFEKLQRLRKSSDLISKSQLDRVRLARDKAVAEFDAAKIQYDALKETAGAQEAAAEAKTESVAAGHDRSMAMIPYESLKAQRALLVEQIKEAELPAPITGTVLKIYTQPGETVGRSPILQMADLSKMVCIAEVDESSLRNVTVGQKAVITSPAFRLKEKVHGKVTAIGRIILAPELKKLDPFSKADVRMVEVTIEIDPGADTDQAAQLVNLQADVEIEAE